MQNKNRPLVYMIRQNAVLALLVFTVTFFLVPFQALITFNGFARVMHEAQGMLEPSWYNDLTRNISSILISCNTQETLSFAFAGIGFISAYILFRHLFSRKQAILIASLPLRRRTDFLNRFVVYLIGSFLPSALCLLLYPLFAHMTGFGAYLSIKPWMQICVLLLVHLYGYAVGALSAALTGQVWSCVGMARHVHRAEHGKLGADCHALPLHHAAGYCHAAYPPFLSCVFSV